MYKSFEVAETVDSDCSLLGPYGKIACDIDFQRWAVMFWFLKQVLSSVYWILAYKINANNLVVYKNKKKKSYLQNTMYNET